MSRQRLGQHYLTDRRVVDKIIASANIQPDERVLEIGTGRGVLTRELMRLGAGLEAYEVDRGNRTATLEVLGAARAIIHLGDAFKETPCFDVLVSSLPYSRSATFVEWISQVEYDRAVVLLQEDFVHKALAAPGTRDYRAMSAIAQISSEIEVLMKVGRESFLPPPKVNSLLISVKPKRRMAGAEISKVKLLFSLRRRQVVSAMAKLGMAQPETDYGKRRVYSLTPEEVLEICGLADGPAGARRVFMP
ncbi:MAG: rRNA adenine N-6-methyltransferase family protein [Nitrososphaerales archaeon]|jgi:16S rRNA A1518/A1519 N6-dimethyltransferase RsmA/KsgA/DIM1 with predicted DNA glycosylase/AP lyase activity